MKKINIAIFGMGRIGETHLKNIIDHPKCYIRYIFDPNPRKVNFFKKKYNVKAAKNISEIFKDKSVDVIYISSSTNSHLELIIKAIKSKKFIFCEKPIDLNLRKINKFKNICNNYNKTLQIGFNRRYDLSISNLLNKCKKKKVGNIEKVIITSRDRSAPTKDYIKSSGGILRDCSIHDIDLINNIFEKDKIKEVFCYASNLFDRNIKKLNDHDTIVSIFKTYKGKIGIINNSRRSVYGYDQRVEVFGSKGMLQMKNINENDILEYNSKFTESKSKHLNFFLERYSVSFKAQLNDFINSVISNKKAKVSFEDCRKTLIICEALYKSIKMKKSIRVNIN